VRREPPFVVVFVKVAAVVLAGQVLRLLGLDQERRPSEPMTKGLVVGQGKAPKFPPPPAVRRAWPQRGLDVVSDTPVVGGGGEIPEDFDG
jgi:hypothetical protein